MWRWFRRGTLQTLCAIELLSPRPAPFLALAERASGGTDGQLSRVTLWHKKSISVRDVVAVVIVSEDACPQRRKELSSHVCFFEQRAAAVRSRGGHIVVVYQIWGHQSPDVLPGGRLWNRHYMVRLSQRRKKPLMRRLLSTHKSVMVDIVRTAGIICFDSLTTSTHISDRVHSQGV